MKKIQYTIYKRDTGNASGKAKKDCLETLEKIGFKQLYNPSDIRVIRIVQQFLSLIRLLLCRSAKVFVLQYPAVHEMFYQLIERNIHENDVSIAVIHDLLALQSDTKERLESEIAFLNKFKYIIVPNDSMKTLIKNNGGLANIVNMEIYDYLHDGERKIVDKDYDNTICFAGNLHKSKFLEYLDEVPQINFLLYGKDGDYLTASNVEYKGCLPADELVYKLEGDYGLVWDGDSLDECSGTIGRYLLYNSPHKLSSYIAAGKPVITWDKAAIAEFVIENEIGVVVSSLRDLMEMNLSNNYEKYKNNTIKLKKKLAKGFYLENAVNKILKMEKV